MKTPCLSQNIPKFKIRAGPPLFRVAFFCLRCLGSVTLSHSQTRNKRAPGIVDKGLESSSESRQHRKLLRDYGSLLTYVSVLPAALACLFFWLTLCICISGFFFWSSLESSVMAAVLIFPCNIDFFLGPITEQNFSHHQTAVRQAHSILTESFAPNPESRWWCPAKTRCKNSERGGPVWFGPCLRRCVCKCRTTNPTWLRTHCSKRRPWFSCRKIRTLRKS